MTLTLEPTIGGKFYHSGLYTGDSEVIAFVGTTYAMTGAVSNILGGTVTLQYALGPKSHLSDGTLSWYNSKLKGKSTNSALEFLTPVTYLRVLAGSGVSYKLELLGLQ